ncbi:hypothetical protein BH20ACT24_BH20ACT24_18610 [soil metagenome]
MRQAVAVTLEQLGDAAERVSVDIPHDLPDLDIEPERLQLVLANLLDNALKFSPAGSGCEGERRTSWPSTSATTS